MHSFLSFSLSAALIFSAATPNAASKCSLSFLTAIGVQIGPVAATCLAICVLCISILQRLYFFPETFFHPSFRRRIKSFWTTKMRAIRTCTALASYITMMQLCVAEPVRPCCCDAVRETRVSCCAEGSGGESDACDAGSLMCCHERRRREMLGLQSIWSGDGSCC